MRAVCLLDAVHCGRFSRAGQLSPRCMSASCGMRSTGHQPQITASYHCGDAYTRLRYKGRVHAATCVSCIDATEHIKANAHKSKTWCFGAEAAEREAYLTSCLVATLASSWFAWHVCCFKGTSASVVLMWLRPPVMRQPLIPRSSSLPTLAHPPDTAPPRPSLVPAVTVPLYIQQGTMDRTCQTVCLRRVMPHFGSGDVTYFEVQVMQGMARVWLAVLCCVVLCSTMDLHFRLVHWVITTNCSPSLVYQLCFVPVPCGCALCLRLSFCREPTMTWPMTPIHPSALTAWWHGPGRTALPAPQWQ